MRILQLDILRGVAILLVLGRHMFPCPPERSAWLHDVTRVWNQGGWIGVDLFFVLSGFLVSGLLFREYQQTGAARAGNFLIRRGFKIYPAFWALLIATFVFGGTSRASLGRVLGELFFLQNYLGGLWNHTWSLAIEEHFYFLLAGWVAWRCRRHPEAPFTGLPLLFGAIAVACLALRAATALWVPYSHLTHVFPTHLRIDSLLFGALLSYGWHLGGLRKHPWLSRGTPLLAAAGLTLVLPPFFFPIETTPLLTVIGLPALYVGFGLLLLSMLSIDSGRFRPLRGLGRIGLHSYSIYLWHLPVVRWGIPWAVELNGGLLDWFVYAGLYLAGSIVLGIATAKLIEVPAVRLRDRLYPSRSGGLQTAAS